MNILITAVSLLVAGFVLWKFLNFRRKGLQTKPISINDIGEIYHQISNQCIETSFAVFIFTPLRQGNKETIEIQFSVENKITGLDWILMSEPNIREKLQVEQFALEKDLKWKECEMNGWIYLRIEQGNLVEFCTSLLRDLYKVDNALLKYGGFKLGRLE